MECTKCGGEWKSPSNIVFEKCPFCLMKFRNGDDDSTDDYKSDLRIEEVIDIETNQIIFADDFFSQRESEIINARRTLELAIQTSESKFHCLFCEQKVKISGRYLPKISRNIYYFSHLVNSDDCPIKTGINLSLKEILIKKYNGYKESELHLNLKNLIADRLCAKNSIKKGISNVSTEKIFKNLNISDLWRRPDVKATLNDKSLVFELQLSTTFLSVVVGRDAFYKMHNTFIIWIFPFFNLREEWQKLMEKDIYYTHKRNVFVLDEEAKIESFSRSELILKCYWQIPVIVNDKVEIKWERKLVSIDELTFDFDTYDAYYYNSDIDFYNCSNQEQQAIIDAWEDSKEVRWNKLFNRNSRFSTSDIVLLSENNNIVYNGRYWGFRNSYGEMITSYKYDTVGGFSEGFAKIKLNDKWGFIDSLGQEITEIIYDEAGNFNEGVAKVKIRHKFGYVNSKGKICVDINYDELRMRINNLVVVKLDDKMGILDINTSKAVIPIIYDKISVHYENVGYVVELNDMHGVITDNGETLIPIEYDRVDIFSKEYILISKNRKWGCYDHLGCLIIPIKYDSMDGFSEGLSVVEINKKHGYINTNGKLIIEPKYDYSYEFKNCIAIVQKGNYFGLINKDGEKVIPIAYDSIDEFGEQSYLLRQNENYYLYNTKNYKVFRLNYQKVGLLKNSLSLVQNNKKYGFIDEYGNEKISIIYDYAEIFGNNGLAKVELNNRMGYIDKNGFKVSKFKYDLIGDFCYEQYAVVKLSEKYGVIDKNLREIIPTKYDQIKTQTNGSIDVIRGFGFQISLNKRWGVLNFRNKMVIPIKYDEISESSKDIFIVKINDKYGCINKNGEVFIPIIYDHIDRFYNEISKVKLCNKFGYVNMKNEVIIPIKYDKIEGEIWNKILTVRNNGKYGFIDLIGKELTPLKFEFASSFSFGVAVVKINQKFGLINKMGNPITAIVFDEINVKILPIVKLCGKYGVLNSFGNEIVPIIYDIIDVFNDKICVKLDNKFGLFDMMGKSSLPVEYDVILKLSSNCFGLKSKGKWYIVNNDCLKLNSDIYDNIGSSPANMFICNATLNNKRGWVKLSGKWEQEEFD